MKDFLYDDILGSDFGLIPCCFDSSNNVETVNMGSQFENNMVKVIGTDEQLIITDDYSSTLSINFQACKFDCMDGMVEISPEEYSKISRWLNRKESHKFKIKQEGYEQIYFLGRFNVQAIKLNTKIIGVDLTFISNYPYGFLDEISATYSGKNFMLYDHSDEEGEILPNVIIECLESGDLEIRNDMDNEIFVLKNCCQGEVLNINGKNHIIITNEDDHIPTLQDDYNYNDIKICNTYNNKINNYSSSLDINITFVYSPIRKVGV